MTKQQVLYKATRPDGTDFRTGTVDYGAALLSGETIRHPAKRVKDDPSTYLSVSTVPTDCTGMSWPCRLFVVKNVGTVIRNNNLSNKRCCTALKVLEERPAHEALGPQGKQVAAVIKQTGEATTGQLKTLDAACGGGRGAALDAAWGAPSG